MKLKNSELAVIFDIGGVLIDWNPRYLYRKLFTDQAAMETFLTEVCSPEWNSKQDAGRPFSEAISELIIQYPEQESLIRAWFDRWPEMIGGAIESTVEVLSELKERGYQLFALSNWSAETFPYARERFDFLKWFNEIVVSGEVKLIKPDRRIYDLFLKKTGWEASQCLFIDDSESNISVAKQLGFQAIYFQSAELLRVDLHQMGFLSY